MTEFYMICGLYAAILLSLSGCSRLQTHTHDNKAVQVNLISTETECKAEFNIEYVKGDAGDNITVDNPFDGAGK